MSEIICECCGREDDCIPRMLCTACEKNLKGMAECCVAAHKLKAENVQLKEYVQWIFNHTTDTCNAGIVLRNTTPQMIRFKAEQLLKEKP